MRHSTTLATPLLVLLLAACGSDSDPSGPDVLDISGSWSFRTTDVTGAGFTCSQSGSTLTITQSGASFTGQVSGGTVECETENSFFTIDVDSDRLVNGSIDGTGVEFELDVEPGTSFQGTATASAMSGTVTELLFNGDTGGIDTLTGSWSATR